MELLLDLNGTLHVIRERQTLEQITICERMPEFLKRRSQ
jgi:hypothetical protein